MMKTVQKQDSLRAARPKAPQGNWLVLDEALKPEWEREASAAVSEICKKEMTVTLVLPMEADVKTAYENNTGLKGVVSWSDNEGHKLSVYEPLPFHGVFVLNNPRDRFAQLAVWNSYLKPLSRETNAGVDDLTHRHLQTFPRQLLDALCKRMRAAEKDGAVFDNYYWRTACLLPVKTWLDSRAALVRRVRPNNASDLMAQICGVRRYVVSRDKAMGYSIEKRMNDASFDGRICPVDTPESEMVGISLQLARGAWVDKDGIIHPSDSAKAIDRISWGTALIPFSHNNDGARDMMGAKNLRQAVPISGREEPCVKTGAEKALAEIMAPLMDAGICPESRDHGKTCIAMGRDLLVAYMPWNGWNLDDAVVVSESVVNKMSVVERKVFSSPVKAHWRISDFKPEDRVSCGDVIARFTNPSGRELVIRYNDEADARVTLLKYGGGTGSNAPDMTAVKMFSYEIEKEIPLGPGDKLMARHGNKGVVGRVLPESEMPRLPDDERLPKELRGKAVEILVNPHGVLSRMNPGQLLETHLGWLIKAGGYGEDDVRAKSGTDHIGTPEVGMLDYGKVQNLLEKTGLDRNGKIKLVLPSGEETQNPVVVGYEHFVRLHHIPGLKAQARGKGDGAAYNSVTQQPAHGRKLGGGQRLGEMEVWALCAYGADHVLEEMLGAKSDRDWSGAWAAAGDAPLGKDEAGNDKYGFAHLLHDWLRALCIGIEKRGNAIKFKFLDDGEALKREIGGAGKRVVSGKTYEEATAGHFACSAGNTVCRWSLPGIYPASKGNLKFGALLGRLGYDSSGPLEDMGDGQYTVALSRKGRPAGRLSVKLADGYERDATTLNLVVTPLSNKGEPVGWPSEPAFQEICLRAVPMARMEEIEKYQLKKPAGKRQIPLPAVNLLAGLKDGASKRSIDNDFRLVCPRHSTDFLKIGPPFDVAKNVAKGGLFDPDIFAGKDDWGFIELPESIDYPYWKASEKAVGGKQSRSKKSKPADAVKISVIPVLPVHYRQPRDVESLSIDRSDISYYYQMILYYCQKHEEAKSGDRPVGSSDKGPAKIQKAVADLFAELSRRIEAKHGFLRHDGLGRRVNRSFRLVITPNPTLRWDEAGVPADVLWEMFGDRVLQDEAADVQAESGGDTVERNVGWTWKSKPIPKDACARVKRFLEKHRDFVILLNRQPTLHRDGMQAFHPVPLPPEAGEVLQLSPLCCEGFAADFDGDEMAGHYPVTQKAQEDSQKLLPSRNVRSIATGNCLAHLDRDLVTGLELVHRAPKRYRGLIGSEFKKDGVDFDPDAEALLANPRLAPGEFGKGVFRHWCVDCPGEAAKKIGALSRVAFRACTQEGISFGFFDLRDARIEAVNDLSGECRVTGEDSPLAVMVNSGANGARQIRQVVLRRGRLESIDADGKGCTVDGGDRSLVYGMGWKQFFDASQNARYSMCLKKIGTQRAGHLTRQLVLALWDWIIAEEDCGCAGESRSLLTCACNKHHGHGICARCFGILPNGERPWVGMPIGLVAAQVLGERGTQLSMRAFHAGNAEVDITTVSRLMTGRDDVGEMSSEEFIGRLRQGAYAKIDERYFQLLWKVLQSAPGNKLTSVNDDPFAVLARGSQMDAIRGYASSKTPCYLDSPFARVLFNLFGGRNMNGGGAQ